ncbi:MAG: hypothetical protein GX750_00305 [Clostridia bacterium]|nr:hypothetical protein [Clostridia bacterium]
MGYKYEFTWLLRLPVDQLPEEPGQQYEEEETGRILWKRSSGNIILGYTREGMKLSHPVGMEVIIVNKSEVAIGIGKVVKSEIYQMPNGLITTVVEFTVKRFFDEQEKEIITRVILEMYGPGKRE